MHYLVKEHIHRLTLECFSPQIGPCSLWIVLLWPHHVPNKLGLPMQLEAWELTARSRVRHVGDEWDGINALQRTVLVQQSG